MSQKGFIRTILGAPPSGQPEAVQPSSFSAMKVSCAGEL